MVASRTYTLYLMSVTVRLFYRAYKTAPGFAMRRQTIASVWLDNQRKSFPRTSQTPNIEAILQIPNAVKQRKPMRTERRSKTLYRVTIIWKAAAWFSRLSTLPIMTREVLMHNFGTRTGDGALLIELVMPIVFNSSDWQQTSPNLRRCPSFKSFCDITKGLSTWIRILIWWFVKYGITQRNGPYLMIFWQLEM